MKNKRKQHKQVLLSGAVIRIAKARARVICEKVSFRGISEFDDILQDLLIKAVDCLEKYKDAPSGGASISQETYLYRVLESYGKNIVRSYQTHKRKMNLEFEQIEDWEHCGEIGGSTSQNLPLIIDIREAVSRLTGELKMLAEAFMEGNIEKLQWSSKKLSKRKIQLREKLSTLKNEKK